MDLIRKVLNRSLVAVSLLVMASTAATASSGLSVSQGLPANTKAPSPAQKAQIQSAYGKLPLSFVQNNGQVNAKVKFYERSGSQAIWFTQDGVYLALTHHKAERSLKSKAPIQLGRKPSKLKSASSELVKLSLVKANKHPVIVSENKQIGHVNYFIGRNPKKWKTDIPTWQAVRYKAVYPGVDVRYYGNNRRLEYDIVVRPGANPSQVKFRYQGIRGLKITMNGDLDVQLKHGHLVQKKPVIYQEIAGKRVAVTGAFKLRHAGKGQYAYGFKLGEYDHKQELVIDPTLVYSTYLGGSSDVDINYIAVDGLGNAYIVGSGNLPTAPPIQGSIFGNGNGFIAKINAAGTAIVYSDYLVGSVAGIAVDGAGNAYVTGTAAYANFPTVAPIQASCPVTASSSACAIVAKINAAGDGIVYSTFLGGSGFDVGIRIAIDGSGNAYVTGSTTSSDFPTVSPIQATYGGGPEDAFAAKINATGTALIYSTYLGGSDDDDPYGIAVDQSGNAYIVGTTDSTNFPTASALQPTSPDPATGNLNGFFTKINATGGLVYSTYLSGNYGSLANGVAVDGSGNVYVTGETASMNFPVTTLIGTLAGVECNGAAFVTKFNTSGHIVYSTCVGHGGSEAWGVAVDGSGNAYVTGATQDASFPTLSPIQATYSGNVDVFVFKLNPTGNHLVYSTYLGGNGNEMPRAIALDGSGNAYIAGYTQATNYPTTSSAIQTTYGGAYYDAFVSKISAFTPPPTLSWSTEPGYGSVGVNPATGLLSTTFTYKVIYTNVNDTAPVSIRVCIDGTCNPMSVDTGAAATLHDGNYANGEQYVYTTQLAVGSHTYNFDTTDGVTTVSLPASGTLSGPNVSDLAISTTSLPNGTLGVAYNATLSASGGTPPYSWSAAGLPAGLSLDTSTGAITGTPTTPSTYAFTVTVTDAANSSTNQLFTIVITAPVASATPNSLTFPSQTTGTTSSPQTVTLTNTGTETMSISSIVATGDFTQTNNCGSSLAIGASCAINVSFAPKATGTRTGAVTINSNASNSPTQIALTGAGTTPVASLSMTSLTFSSQPNGTTSSPQAVTLTNTGTGPLAISSIVTTGDFTQTNTCGSSLAVGANCVINVSFAPTATGTLTGAVTINSDASNSPTQIALTGTGTPAPVPVVALSPSSLTFSSQAIGTTSGWQRVILKNSGTGPLTISSIVATGDFTQTNTCGSSLAVGATCGFQVYFAPTAAGTRTGAVTINSDASNSPTQIALTGTSPTPVPVVALSPSSLTFSNQAIGTTSGWQRVILKNSGTGPLTISSIVATGDFTQTNTCGSSLAVGATCGFQVYFAPTAAGTRTGAVTINSDASNSPTQIALTGTSPTPVPVVALSPSSLTFSTQAIGTTSGWQGVILKNSGTGPLTITSIVATGDFTQTNTCGSSLAVGATCGFQVYFAPTAAGTRTGAVTINSDASNSPTQIALIGASPTPVPVVALSPSSLMFSSQPIGTTSGWQRVILKNSGTGPLTISSIVATGDFTQTNTCGSSLAVGSTCGIKVYFAPTAAGTRTGAVTINSNASNSPTQITLTGTSPTPVPVVALSPSSLMFSSQPTGTTSGWQRVILKNSGTGPLTISSIVATGDFTQTNTCGSSLAVGSTCGIKVYFAPTAAGTRTGAVTINSDASNSPSQIALTGTGN